jgi:hypothetical protein
LGKGKEWKLIDNAKKYYFRKIPGRWCWIANFYEYIICYSDLLILPVGKPGNARAQSKFDFFLKQIKKENANPRKKNNEKKEEGFSPQGWAILRLNQGREVAMKCSIRNVLQFING